MLLINYDQICKPSIEYIFKSLENLKCYYYCYHNIKNNYFISNEDRDNILKYIEKNSRLRNLCRKFIINCKKSIMKTNHAINDIDLLFNNIDELPEKEKINLYENGKKYIFSKNDIVSIFTTALLECSDGWPLPKIPKNPYTNLEFKNEQLIKLSSSIENKPFVMVLLEEYNFNIDEMKSYHLGYFKKNAINEEYNELEHTEVDSIIKVLIKKFTEYRLNKDYLEEYRNKFHKIIKDFNLMTNSDSRYLKNYLYQNIKNAMEIICCEYPQLISLKKNLVQRKYLRVKRIKTN
jgi:hypothetical protein